MNEFKKFKGDFVAVTKRILKKELSTNPETLKKYETDLKLSFNALVEFTSSFYTQCNTRSQQQIRSDLIYARDRLIRSFGRLNIEIKVSTNLLDSIVEDIDENFVEEDFDENSDNNSEHNSEHSSENNSETMSMNQHEFLRLAAQTIPKNYDGDPQALTAFVNAIKLLKTVAGATHIDILRQFLATRLEGKALDAASPEPATVDALIAALTKHIKPDNSSIIESRMMALRADRMKVQDFSKQAEDLANDLKRSLIVEGVSSEKANEMVVKKTTEICRSTAKSELLRTVMAASTFNTVQEVLSKFNIESANETKEHSVLAYRTYRNPGYRGKQNNYRGHSRGNYRGNGQRNYQNNNNYRGNGRGRSNDNQRSNNNGRGRGSNRNYTVRYAENEQSPSEDRRGAHNQEDQN